LQTEYENWFRKNAFTLSQGRPPIPLKDFRTGLSEVRKYESVVFQLKELFKTKIVEESKPSSKMKVLDKPESKNLGDFKDALED
jgi:hypothetical protein